MATPIPLRPTEGAAESPAEARIPRHVGVIMDGNGRWAERRGEPRTAGHKEGATAVTRTVRACRERGVEVLTLYAFSAQNWARPQPEVAALMQLLYDYVLGERDEIMGTGIRLRAIGDVEQLPAFVKGPLRALEAESRGNGGMILALALSYGAREELVRSARRLAERVARGELDPADIDEAALGGGLDTAGWPDPDLVIRTGGEARLSNFLLWQAAYAELYFTPVPWPEFTPHDLDAAFAWYADRQRRFGLTGRQVEARMERASC